jgi:predicted NUDIX family NTP pyrophosphohydrolase
VFLDDVKRSSRHDCSQWSRALDESGTIVVFGLLYTALMPRTESAGLLLYRRTAGHLEVLLAHMGGPFWSKKELSWTIPKGHREEAENDLLAVAEREFAEEMGSPAPAGATLELGSVRSGTKTIFAFAREADFDASAIVSNTFTMEWPYHSGRMVEFPEVDRAAWFDRPAAAELLVASQVPFLSRLSEAAHLSD